ncbi:hypothetical protein GCM10023186_08440 [Hymenobacter koreensis]|uniref:BD-FAE-like domain-containing protein n=1 Tax=Hymenobacter koreensis TaxID=1084523 RepID=A0ABP8IVI4_9BACT
MVVSGAQAQSGVEAPGPKEHYLAEQKSTGKVFGAYFYPRYSGLYALAPAAFVTKMDSARQVFDGLLGRYAPQLEARFVEEQRTENRFYFDRLLLDYPDVHHTYTGQKATLPAAVTRRLRRNQADFDRPELLTNNDFKEYFRSYLRLQVKRELRKPAYARQDNQWLQATWQLLPQLIQNRQCREFWQQEYLYNHLDNHGVKNVADMVGSFNASCQDTAYRGKINRLYEQELAGRRGHMVRSYKTVGAQSLDLHLFGAAPSGAEKARPAIVFFHGGSWSEGKPDWFFGVCEDFAKRGWVACAVEYRTVDRHNTLPFAAVRDARSAMRWLRQHATELGLDTARIVATGNSAGGHLAVATALATGHDEPTDDLRWSPHPNAVVANAGVYDLTTTGNSWIGKDLKDKAQVRSISPVHLVRPGLPPMLLLHGTQDGNVPVATAEAFRQAAAGAGNRIELVTLPGAGHFIWFDPRFGKQVAERRNAFLQGLGY